jgi:hypothetical protein
MPVFLCRVLTDAFLPLPTVRSACGAFMPEKLAHITESLEPLVKWVVEETDLVLVEYDLLGSKIWVVLSELEGVRTRGLSQKSAL